MEQKPKFDFEKFDICVNDFKTEVKGLESVINESLNLFPVDVFPRLFTDLLTECEKSLNFPVDYTGTAILSAVSTAIGKSAKIKVKEGWYEFASTYMAILGNAGANKSHPLDLAFKPFASIDKESIDAYTLLFNEYKEYNELSKSERKERLQPQKPILKKTVLHNFTPEILHQRLADNERGCAVVSEELATFLEGMNNYSKGDQSSIYLSFWSNKSTSIDRVSKDVPLWVPQPYLNIIGGLQPRVLQKLFPTGKSDSGFLQRFLFAFPEKSEKKAINDFELEPGLIDEYTNWIKNLQLDIPVKLNEETGDYCPKIYQWSNEAKVFFYHWQKLNTEQVNANAESLDGEVISKFDIHFIRLSLILQVMEDCNSNQISLKAVQGAERLCKYYLNNAIKVLEILESNDCTISLPQNKKAFYDSLPNHFTTSEANMLGKSKSLNTKAVQRLLSDKLLFDKLAQGQYSKKSKK